MKFKADSKPLSLNMLIYFKHLLNIAGWRDRD